MTHHHFWHWEERGIGEYVKGKQKLILRARGCVAVCDCGTKMFFPDDDRLNPVEVVS